MLVAPISKVRIASYPYSNAVIKWPIPAPTQLELVALVALRACEPSLKLAEPLHAARVRVPGLRSTREVDVLLITRDPKRRITFEAQKRGRRVTQPTLDSFEGKMPQINADQTVMISEAGFAKDVIRRVKASGGRLRAITINDEGLVAGISSAEANLHLALSDGQAGTANLRSVSIVDSVGGYLGHALYGIVEELRLMVIVTSTDKVERDGGTASIVVLGPDLQPISVATAELRVSSSGRLVDSMAGVPAGGFRIPTGRIVP